MERQNLQQYLVKKAITVPPTPSGLYFIETAPGTGPKPVTGQWIKLHFAVSNLNDTLIYSSFNDKPAEMEFGKQFENKAVTEAIGMMSKGERARLVVPSDLAFAEKGNGKLVPPYTSLVYELQIVDILSKEKHDAEIEKIRQERLKKSEQNKIDSKRFLDENKNKPGIVTLPDGLQYKILKEGSGPKPKLTDQVKVSYRGTIIDGTVFDSSYDRKEVPAFRVDGVIQGWSEALQLMPVGSKWMLYIPSELAYKDNGRGKVIEPNMALIFEVELVDIVK
jgi:FKBP-type peptidyl-prolyl cis-trans isomerase